jgi:hypothetical protein
MSAEPRWFTFGVPDGNGGAASEEFKAWDHGSGRPNCEGQVSEPDGTGMAQGLVGAPCRRKIICTQGWHLAQRQLV